MIIFTNRYFTSRPVPSVPGVPFFPFPLGTAQFLALSDMHRSGRPVGHLFLEYIVSRQPSVTIRYLCRDFHYKPLVATFGHLNAFGVLPVYLVIRGILCNLVTTWGWTSPNKGRLTCKVTGGGFINPPGGNHVKPPSGIYQANISFHSTGS